MENTNLNDHQQENGDNLISGPTDKISDAESKCEGHVDMQNAREEKGYDTASASSEVDGNSFSQSDKGSHEDGGANLSGVEIYENQKSNSGVSRHESGVNFQTDFQAGKFNDDTATDSKKELDKNLFEGDSYSQAVDVNNVKISVPGNLKIIDVTQDFCETSKSSERTADINKATAGTTTKVEESDDQFYNENDNVPLDAGEVRETKENANLHQCQKVVTREDNNAAFMDKEAALAKLRQGQTYDEEEDFETAEEVAVDYEAYDRAREKYVYFWKSHDIYSQWHQSVFHVGGLKFTCAEQFMMYKKAVLFKDQEIADEILHCKDPRKIKALGRKVRGFDPYKWQRKCLYIVKEGNKAKFTQENSYLADMLFTYPKVLVEASPFDNIWGIGLDEDSPGAWDESTWQGTNYLGYVLTEVRDDIMVERGMIDEQDRMRYIDNLLTAAECPIDAKHTEGQVVHGSERKLELEKDRHNREENTENNETYFLFSHGIFSQFYEAYFEIDEIEFNCAEQYMMYKKAVLFEDYETADEILKSTDPGKIKYLGRKVKGFDNGTWQQHCLHFVKEGNMAKFSSSKRLKKAIVTTYPQVLVEANPYDKIWGIGLDIKDRRAKNKRNWLGKNFLGFVLTEARDELMFQWGLIKEEKKSTYIDKLKEDWDTPVHVESQEESMTNRQSGNHRYDNSKEHNRRVTGDKHRENAQRNKGKHGAQENTQRDVYHQAQGGGHHDQRTQSNQLGDKKKQDNRKKSSMNDESVVADVEIWDWENVEKKRDKKGKNVQNVPETDKSRQGLHNERDNKHTDRSERTGHAVKTDRKPDTKKVIVEDRKPDTKKVIVEDRKPDTKNVIIEDFDINEVMSVLSGKGHEKTPPSSPAKSKHKGKRGKQHDASEVIPEAEKVVANVESGDLEHVEKKKDGKKGKNVQNVPEADRTRQGSNKHNDRDNKHTDTSERSGHADKIPASSPAKSQPKGKGVQQHGACAEEISKADAGNTEDMSGQVMSRRQRKNLKKKQK